MRGQSEQKARASARASDGWQAGKCAGERRLARGRATVGRRANARAGDGWRAGKCPRGGWHAPPDVAPTDCAADDVDHGRLPGQRREVGVAALLAQDVGQQRDGLRVAHELAREVLRNLAHAVLDALGDHDVADLLEVRARALRLAALVAQLPHRGLDERVAVGGVEALLAVGRVANGFCAVGEAECEDVAVAGSVSRSGCVLRQPLFELGRGRLRGEL